MSPTLHNTFYTRNAIDAVMIAIAHPDIAQVVQVLRTVPIALAAITVPHKQTIMPLLDEIDPMAQHVGAVNTVINRNDTLVGYNTDIDGIAYALKDIPLRGKDVLLLGAGGAASVCAAYIAQQGGNLICYNRTPEKAQQLATHWKGTAVGTIQDLLPRAPQIIINATTVGMFPAVNVMPLPQELLMKGQVVFDVIYNPQEKLLLKTAREAGARIINGLPMFIAQGLAQERLWQNIKSNPDEYTATIQEQLNQQHYAR